MANNKNAAENGKTLDYTHILPISVIEMNDGQLEGLPKNPRYIKDERFAKLKLSLETSPEFLEANPLKVYPLDNGHYIIIGGNMRFLAGKEVGIKEFPCYIFKKETTIEKLKEFVIKDNIPFGSTDWDSLANDGWDVGELEDWGMDVSFLGENDGTDIDDLFEEVDNQEEKQKVIKITVNVPEDLSDGIDEIIDSIKEAVSGYEGIEVKK